MDFGREGIAPRAILGLDGLAGQRLALTGEQPPGGAVDVVAAKLPAPVPRPCWL